ncbi:MAG TPA: T9SS type A sorting domain-containing protein, partial [Bacteroidia bacterium]|nr:T9SS type A sorting domain-containing protein [Bacteroidia bacterium]
NPTCAQSGGFYCPMTMYADGTLPPYGTPNYLLDFTDPNWGSCWAINSIRIFQVSIDWTLKTGALSLYQTLPTAAFNSLFNGRNSIDQPSGNNASLDALDGFFSYRIPYMRWASYNAAVMCNPVNVGTNPTSGSFISGVRWYELRQDTGTKMWSIYQQGTYAPNDQVSRWNPGIAMDQNGSIGLEYSASDPTATYPSLYFTGRRACDTLGTMTLAEGEAVVGNSVVTTYGRWGDYSHLSVDPTDGITFWGTNSYGNSTITNSALATRIFSFQIPKCIVGIPNINDVQAELSAFQSGNQLNVKGIKLPGSEKIAVELYDINGKRILTNSMNSGSGTVETSFNVSAIAKGVYFVRIGNDSFLRVVKLEIQ